MAHLSFPQKIQLWWNASRLLAGMPVKAEFWDSLPSHSQSVATETWKEWGLSDQDDGRYWLLAGLKKNEVYTLSRTYRLALLDVLMSEMSPEAQNYFINHNQGGVGTKAVISLRPPLDPEDFTHTLEGIQDISPHDQLLIKAAAVLAGDGDLVTQIPLHGDTINGEGICIQNHRISWLMLAVLSSNATNFKHLIKEGLNPKVKIGLPEFFKNECQVIRDRWWKKLTEESRLSPRVKNEITSRWKERLPSLRQDYASSHACNIYAAGILEVLIEGGYVSDVQDLYEKSAESSRFALLGLLAQKKSPLEITTVVGEFLKNWAKSNYIDDNQHMTADAENASKNFLSKLSLLSDWNYDHKVFGDVVLYAAKNKKVSPNFVQHLLEGGQKGVAQWWVWNWNEERYVLDEVFLNKNQAFLKGCANQGVGVHNLHRKCALLALIIAHAPDALEAWLEGVDAKHLKAAWNMVNPEWVNRKIIMMVSGDRAIDLLFRSEQSEKLIDLLANHAVGKTVLGLNSVKEWTNLALASKNVENLEAVFKYIGKVEWEEEEMVGGWLKCLAPPLNPILLDRILEEKWCLNVRIDNQDNTPLHRLIGLGEHAWVKKFVEAGANIDLKNKNHFSVRDIAMSGPDLNLMNILALAEKEHLNTTTSLQPKSTHSIRRL